MIYNLLVIGGGINGAAIARDAQGRGIKTLLVEKNDLASGTSSASSKLIHGGLRYLETREFKLVRESLAEREVLMRAAPHIIWPLRFHLVHSPAQRSRWMIRAGLFLYDHLAKRTALPSSSFVRFDKEFGANNPLQACYNKGFSYSDCWVQDARLVVLLAQDLVQRGGDVLTRTEVTSARRAADGSHWHFTLRGDDGRLMHGQAKALINAAGPWANKVDAYVIAKNQPGQLRHVRGSHIVVPKITEIDQAFLLQNNDGRVIFVIPYEGDFTLIGTTDVNHTGDPKAARCTDAEATYLCEAVSRYFHTPVTQDQIVWRFSGVRPLLFEPGKAAQRVSRDHSFDFEGGPDQAPLLSVYGGKLTVARDLAQQALAYFDGLLPMSAPWTRTATLPGGDMSLDFAAHLTDLRASAPQMPADLAHRLLRNYGTYAFDMVERLGEPLGDGVYMAELAHVSTYEFARRSNDFLWRRSKMGLKVSAATQAKIDAFFA